jgi:hypothetical protein
VTATDIANAELADRDRLLGTRAPRRSPERTTALSLAVCLDTTTSPSAARKALADIDDHDIRQAATDLLDQLAEQE